MAICKLCRKDKNLLTRSHIIPAFVYKGMFNDRHKLLLMPIGSESVDKSLIKRPSDGEYEGDLLCGECDNNLLGDYYENYASRIYEDRPFSKENPVFQSCQNQHGVNFIKVSNLDYHKFKLFLLSIIWRASISTRPFFNEINLNQHDNKIREMLLLKNAGSVLEYPIFILTYANHKTLPKEVIAQPRLIKSENGVQLYSFMITGFFYFFYINEPTAQVPQFVIDETIKPNNELNIAILPKDKGWSFILGQSGIKK